MSSGGLERPRDAPSLAPTPDGFLTLLRGGGNFGQFKNGHKP
jgi:hypothetical protein